MVGDLKHAMKIRRNCVEDGQAEVIAIQADLDEIALRIDLAMRRSAAVHDVLAPALDRVADVGDCIRTMRQEFSAVWYDGQARRWEDDQQQFKSGCSLIHCQGLGGDGSCRKGGGHDG